MGLTYAIHTLKNKEFLVQERISSKFKEISIDIPIRLTKQDIEQKVFVYYEKLFPEYVLITCSGFLNKSTFDAIGQIKDVQTVLKDPLEKEDVERFSINSNINKDFSILKGKVNVIFGEYAGNTGKTKGFYNDEVIVMLDVAEKITVKLPIWTIGKEVKMGDKDEF